ncbi:hypothetical protein EYF80_056104 [Liparis tanakae]|uniref:Uncharacterized protein n=1 Tax=Liparis tanakae TaxID=230148 RepID=A0A4Z2EXR6_9TELE|nr:hypothetical protein EYF80_056104 [Liparis tanakae]
MKESPTWRAAALTTCLRPVSDAGRLGEERQRARVRPSTEKFTEDVKRCRPMGTRPCSVSAVLSGVLGINSGAEVKVACDRQSDTRERFPSKRLCEKCNFLKEGSSQTGRGGGDAAPVGVESEVQT